MIDYPNNRPELTEKRRSLRKNPTGSEAMLWQCLRRKQLGVKFRRQFSVDYYIMDFYCHELKLAIEADGYSHELPEARSKDAIRQKFLETRGIRVLRFKDEEILGNVEDVVKRIMVEIERLGSHI